MRDDIKIDFLKESDIPCISKIEESQNVCILKNHDVTRDIKNESYMFFKIEFENKIVGYIATSYCIDTMDILSIVIHKNYSKKGFACLLLEHIIDIAKKKEIKKIFLEVRKSNIAAQRLYEKFNFKYINTRKNYYNDNFEDALVYILSLEK